MSFSPIQTLANFTVSRDLHVLLNDYETTVR